MEKAVSQPRVNFIIERFFIIASLVILLATLSIGIYFNNYDKQEKRKGNLQKIHNMLSQLIIPSLIISDLSEIKRLLYMASGNDETFLIVDNDGTVIMSDYEKVSFSKFVLNLHKSINDCKNLKMIYQYIDDKKYLINCSILKANKPFFGERKLGFLLSFTNYKWLALSPIALYFGGILIGLFLFLIILFRKMLYHYLLQPLIVLKDRISEISTETMLQKTHIDNIHNAPRELIEIKEAFERLLLNLQNQYNKRIEAEKMKALIDLAACVAHDIRSPLLALDVISKDIKNISEGQRLVLRNSANRINDIANNLLTQYKQKRNIAHDNAPNMQPELLSNLLMSLISEKRMQYKNNSIKLVINLDENTHGEFSIIPASMFHRILSNLINNSIEAFSSEIQISLSILKYEENNKLNITIQDNGNGIPFNILERIIKGESISNKKTGHGLGLVHAIKTIERECSGEFYIKSTIQTGTVINIILPRIAAPAWFLSELLVDPKKIIIILDDDESIHQVWEERFKKIYPDFNFIHHYDPQDLLKWHKNNSSAIGMFLIDYEFMNSTKNGLNVIEELDIAERSFLVTSHHEDSNVHEYSEKMGVKIIPKTFAAYVPIILSNDI